jgi:hypothetical protein
MGCNCKQREPIVITPQPQTPQPTPEPIKPQ